MKTKLIALFLLTLVLTACGGGGGGGGSSGLSVGVASLSLAGNVINNQIVWAIAVGDLNNDGLDDVVAGGWAGVDQSRLYVFIQNNDGTLTDKTSTLLPNAVYPGSQKIFIADFDNDGRKDIFLPGFDDCNGCIANSVVYWNAPGQFVRQVLPEQVSAHGACYSDLDNDGDLDVLVSGGFGGSVGGIYINNANRSFTLRQNILPQNSFDSCSINHEANGDISIAFGNNNQVVGYPSTITVFDSSMNFKYNIPVASSNVADGLINSTTIDANGDGLRDFVLIFNDNGPGQPGAKEVWLNNGNGYAYSYTIDNQYNNLYYTTSLRVNNHDAVFFGAPNDDARLYVVNNNTWTPYSQSSFTSMARVGGANPGQHDWSVGASVVYTGNNKIYMLQLLNTHFYTKEL